jgi:hypothetical protein
MEVKVLVSVCGVAFLFITVDCVGTGSSEWNKLELQTGTCNNVGQNCLLTDVQTNLEPYMLFIFILFFTCLQETKKDKWVDG